MKKRTKWCVKEAIERFKVTFINTITPGPNQKVFATSCDDCGHREEKMYNVLYKLAVCDSCLPKTAALLDEWMEKTKDDPDYEY